MNRWNRRAFTLVELMVAVAVSILILGVGLPRYNQLQRQHVFQGQVQQLVGCLQGAQQVTAAPSAPAFTAATVRFSRVTIDLDTTQSPKSITNCHVKLYPYGITDANSTTGDPVPAVTTVPDGDYTPFSGLDLVLCKLSVNGGTDQVSASNASIHLYFDSSSGGTPWLYVNPSILTAPKIYARPTVLGLGMQITVAERSAGCSSKSVSPQIVTIPRSGYPIHADPQ